MPRRPRLAALALVPVALAASPSVAAPPPREDILHIATCPGEAAEYVATMRDQLVLDRAFLDEKTPEDAQIRESIRQQLKYFWGYFRTHVETHAEHQIVLAAEEPEITVLARKEAPYGRDLVLDWKETDPELRITDPYTSRAVARGVAKKDDPGLFIEYEARFRLALCGKPRPTESNLDLIMPRDPWLMHWHVPAAERRLVRYYADKAFTNPCVDDDYADLPHPIYYWYDWLPERHGVDAEGKPLDCRNLLHPGVDYFPRQAKLQRIALPGGQLAALRDRFKPGEKRPLRATVLIGVLDHEWKSFDFAEVVKALGAGSREAPARAARLLAQPTERERGEWKWLRLITDLPDVMEVGEYRSAVEDGYLGIEVSGRLKRSGRAVRLRAFVGITDVLGPTTPHHWGILRRGLATDDIVVYAGHSGVGENFRLSRIEENLKVTPEVLAAEFQKAPFQLIAFLSCYSYMYFGRDLEAAAQHAAGRAFLYTGSPFTKGDRGALAILDLVDQLVAGGKAKSKDGEQPSLRFVVPDDFLMIKEVRVPSAR